MSLIKLVKAGFFFWKAIGSDSLISIKSKYGVKSWQYQLAAAELLAKYGKANLSFQLEHSVQVMLTAIEFGKLTPDQFAELPDYEDLLENAVIQSKLVARTQLSDVNLAKKMVPKLVIDALVQVKSDSDKNVSSNKNGRIWDRLNPFSYFSKKSKLERRFGKVATYLSANQIVDIVKTYSADQRLEVLKYHLIEIESLAPLEVVQLLGPIPVNERNSAFDFLKTKLIGRFDFFAPADFLPFVDKAFGEIFINLVIHSGNQWTVDDFVGFFKNFDYSISDNRPLREGLAVIYTPKDVISYINLKTNLEYKEAVFIADLLIPNAKDTAETREFYSLLSGKLPVADDKAQFEKAILAEYSSQFNEQIKEIKGTQETKEFYKANDLVIFEKAVRKVKYATEDGKVVLAENSTYYESICKTDKISLIVDEFKGLKKGIKVLFFDSIRTIEYVDNNGNVILQENSESYQNITPITTVSKTVNKAHGLKVGDRVIFNNDVRIIEFLDENGRVVLKSNKSYYQNFVDRKSVSLIK